MRSTIPSFQLSITGILRHGTEVHTDQTVATATADGYRETSYSDLGARIAQLAHGLARIGVTPGQRVATFMWNNQEHLEAYFGLPERWAFIDQVPRTGVGKSDKKLIRSRYADGAYDVVTCHD